MSSSALSDRVELTAVPSIAHVLMPFSVQGSTLMSVAQYLINEHSADGGRSIAVLSDNRSVSLKDAELRYVDFTRDCPREWFNRRELGIDIAAGALGRRRPFYGRMYRPAIEALADDPPDVVLLYEGHYAITSLPWWDRLRPRTKIIVYAHNPFSRTYRGPELHRLLGSADGVIFCADHLRQDVRNRLGGDPLPPAVVHNGVDPLFLAREIQTTQRCDEEFRVVFAGTIAAHKGPHVLVEALGLAQQRTQRRLCGVIIGGSAYGTGAMSDYERTLRAQAAKIAAGVEFLPFLGKPELQSWFRRASAVCIPSTWSEGLPLIALEAMASGAPILASDAAGLREACGDAAIFTPQGDATALADRIVALAEQPELREAFAAKSRARGRTFTWRASHDRILEFVS